MVLVNLRRSSRRKQDNGNTQIATARQRYTDELHLRRDGDCEKRRPGVEICAAKPSCGMLSLHRDVLPLSTVEVGATPVGYCSQQENHHRLELFPKDHHVRHTSTPGIQGKQKIGNTGTLLTKHTLQDAPIAATLRSCRTHGQHIERGDSENTHDEQGQAASTQSQQTDRVRQRQLTSSQHT